MSALPRPDLPPGPARALNDALHDLHHQAGWPSLRTLARETGVSHTTVSKTFSRPAVPTWGTLEVLVGAMHGDPAAFHDLWVAATSPTDSTGRPPRIAGRRAELDVVRHHLEAGSGLLLVTGEAGIGKTTLITAAAASCDVETVVGRCLPLSTEVPLMPVVDLLEAVRRVDDGQWWADVLGAVPRHVVDQLARLFPDLSLREPVEGDVDEFARLHLLASLSHVLRRLGRHRRCALMIEDLHWGDGATLDLIEQLLVHDTPPAIVGTWRLEDPPIDALRADWFDRVERAASTTVLELGPLSPTESAEQVRLAVGAAAADTMAREIHDRTRGHPLFNDQLARLVWAQGIVPRRLADLLERRLTGLSSHARTAVDVLAVAERAVSPGLLAEVAELDAVGLQRALRELTDRHLLARDPKMVELRHPLLADSARGLLVPGEEADLHCRLAHALSGQTGADAAEVAAHWRGAEKPHEELAWRVAAARHAHARIAPGQEARQWTRVLDLHGELGRSRESVQVRLAAFDALELDGDIEEAYRVIRVAVEEVDDLDNLTAGEVLRRAAEAESLTTDDTRTAMVLVDRAIERLAPLDPSAALVHSLDMRANFLMDQGRFEEALECLTSGLDVARDLGDDELFFGLCATLGWHHASLGDLAGALARFAEARARLPRSTDPRREAYMAMCHTDALIQHHRPAEEVIAAAEHALAMGREWEMDFHLLAVARANVVEALLATGRVEDATRALAAMPASDRLDSWPVRLMAGRVAIAGGRADEGLMVLSELGVTGSTPGSTLHHRYWIATALMWMDRTDDAWRTLLDALEAVRDDPAGAAACEAYALLARLGADLALGRPALAEKLRSTLLDLRLRASVDPLGAGPPPVVRRVCTEVWDAELARLDGVDTPEAWSRAAASWDGLHSPHDAAYCRWRAAQCALREGRGTVAARLLKRAAADAREHVPLSRAIAGTAAR
jgi:tetratricopeptide (TPR) repeat protein